MDKKNVCMDNRNVCMSNRNCVERRNVCQNRATAHSNNRNVSMTKKEKKGNALEFTYRLIKYFIVPLGSSVLTIFCAAYSFIMLFNFVFSEEKNGLDILAGFLCLILTAIMAVFTILVDDYNNK